MEAITNSLRAGLKGLEIGEAQCFSNLSAFPLLNPAAKPAEYLTLSRAVQEGFATITEVSEGGSVPELLLENRGDKRILILDGEELIGAKQNRIANLSILADANSKTVIPVSCVEQGRWSYRSQDFATSERVMFHRARAKKTAALNEGLKATGTYGADQGMVWNDIQQKQMRMSVNSPTAAMEDIYESHRNGVEDYTAAFTALEHQVGVIFAIDGRIEGMDLFDAPDTFGAMLPKLTRSFAIDAMESARGYKVHPTDSRDAIRLLDRVAAAHADTYPGVGVGTDVRISGARVAGGGLVHDDKLVHLAAFAISSPAQGPSERRRSVRESRVRARRYESMRRRRNDNGDDGDNGGGNDAA